MGIERSICRVPVSEAEVVIWMSARGEEGREAVCEGGKEGGNGDVEEMSGRKGGRKACQSLAESVEEGKLADEDWWGVMVCECCS